MKISLALRILCYSEYQNSCIGSFVQDFQTRVGVKDVAFGEMFWSLSEVTLQHLRIASSIGGYYTGRVG